jgi:hypothetical protein
MLTAVLRYSYPTAEGREANLQCAATCCSGNGYIYRRLCKYVAHVLNYAACFFEMHWLTSAGNLILAVVIGLF